MRNKTHFYCNVTCQQHAVTSFASITKYSARVYDLFIYLFLTTMLRSRTGSYLRTAENDAGGNGHLTQGGMLRLSGPLTQHPERTLLPTHGQFPPTTLGRLLEPFPKPLSTHTDTLTHTLGVRLLTPLVWGSPLTAARPDWSHISPSPGGSDGASEGGFYYTGHLWQPWFPLGTPCLPRYQTAGLVHEPRPGVPCVRGAALRGRLYADGARNGAELRATALGHTESWTPPTGASGEWGAEADRPSTTKHNTQRTTTLRTSTWHKKVLRSTF